MDLGRQFVHCLLAQLVLTLTPPPQPPAQPWLQTIATRPLVENRDAKPTAPIAALTPRPELQIEVERIRRHVPKFDYKDKAM
jgi:hypothetical protein